VNNVTALLINQYIAAPRFMHWNFREVIINEKIRVVEPPVSARVGIAETVIFAAGGPHLHGVRKVPSHIFSLAVFLRLGPFSGVTREDRIWVYVAVGDAVSKAGSKDSHQQSPQGDQIRNNPGAHGPEF